MESARASQGARHLARDERAQERGWPNRDSLGDRAGRSGRPGREVARAWSAKLAVLGANLAVWGVKLAVLSAKSGVLATKSAVWGAKLAGLDAKLAITGAQSPGLGDRLAIMGAKLTIPGALASILVGFGETPNLKKLVFARKRR